MKNLFAPLLVFAVLAVSALAGDSHVFAPARPPDYVTGTGWVEPNLWNRAAGQTSANANTYPITCKAAAPDVLEVVYRQRLQYRYCGSVSVSASAPSMVNVATNSWNAYYLAHGPNAIGGASAFVSDVPWTAWPFNGQSAGGGGAFMSLPPGGTGDLLTAPGSTVTFQEPIASPYPFMTYRANDTNAWRTIDGYRNGRALHLIWVTPVSDPEWAWSYWNAPPGAPWQHVVSYGGQLEVRVTLEVWEIRANDPPLVVVQ